jgi:ABC-type molybdate transport system substrate-binding protein
MKRTRILGMVFGLALALMAWTGGASRTQSQQAPPTAAASASNKPSTQEINEAFVQQISKQIVGHEQEPSGQVFKNIQVDFLKKVPAA